MTYVYAALLIIGSAFLLWQHRRAYIDGIRSSPSEPMRNYLRKQRTRRSIASSCIGLVGLLLIAGDLAGATGLALGIWGVVVALVVGILWLAANDAAATRAFFSQNITENSSDHIELMQEAKRQLAAMNLPDTVSNSQQSDSQPADFQQPDSQQAVIDSDED